MFLSFYVKLLHSLFLRLKALKSLLQALLQAEDVVKVYEARLTERETTSLDPDEVQEYQSDLRVLLI